MANEMRDRLVESMAKRFKELYKDGDWNFNEMLVDVADRLLDDGWIRPSCKVGDTVYIIGLDKKIEKHFVEGICLYQNGLFIEILYNGQGFSLPLNKVFLTESEAEQKLKEMRGGNGNL